MSQELMEKLGRVMQMQSQRSGDDMKDLLGGLEEKYENDMAVSAGDEAQANPGKEVQYSDHETSNLDRWKQQVHAMASHSDPTIRKEGLSQLSQYQQKRNSTKDGDGVSMEQYLAMTDAEKREVDAFRKFNRPTAIQKADRLLEAGAKSAEAYIAEARALGMDNWVDLGDHLENTILVGLPRDQQIRLRKEIAAVKAKEKVGVEQGQFVADYGVAMASGDTMWDDLDYSIEVLSDLAGMTDYSTTGFASWLAGVPAMSATEWRDKRDTLVARLGLGKLMELKAGSSTGSSGLGALSEKELKVLQDFYGNLNQAKTPRKIKRELRKMYGILQQSQDKIRARQYKNSVRYDKLAPGLTNNPEDTSEYMKYDPSIDKSTVSLGKRQTESTASTPKIESKPFSINELIPEGLRQPAVPGMKIGQKFQAQNGKWYEYVGGPAKGDPRSYREVAQ
jgi:hypothetical protein